MRSRWLPKGPSSVFANRRMVQARDLPPSPTLEPVRYGGGPKTGAGETNVGERDIPCGGGAAADDGCTRRGPPARHPRRGTSDPHGLRTPKDTLLRRTHASRVEY